MDDTNAIIRIKWKGDDGYKIISVRLKHTTLDKLDTLSRETNRSRNELINILLENSVDRVEID